MRFKQLPDGSMLDTETGEILDQARGTFLYVPTKIKIKEGWFMSFQDGHEALAADKDLWGRPRAVLDYLMSKLNFENFISVPQGDIAKALKIHQPHVSAALKILVAKGVLELGPKHGKSSSYKLNPFYGWRGSVKNLKEERKRRLTVVKNEQE